MCVILPVKVQWVVIWKGADAIGDGISEEVVMWGCGEKSEVRKRLVH